MNHPFPFGYPKRAIRITPTTSAARTRIREALPTWVVHDSKDLVTAGKGVDSFALCQKRLPSSIYDWREVWALDDAVVQPLVNWVWPDPFPWQGEYCPNREGPPCSFLVIYPDRESALADLARWHAGVELVLELAQSPTATIRSSAQALLAGDLSAGFKLVESLEKSGDPRAARIHLNAYRKPSIII